MRRNFNSGYTGNNFMRKRAGHRHIALRYAIAALLAGLLLPAAPAGAQKAGDCKEVINRTGYRVGSATLDARWASRELRLQIADTIGVGKLYDEQRMSAVLEMVSVEIEKNTNQLYLDQITGIAQARMKGSVAILYVYPQVCDITGPSGEKEASITIRPYFVQVDMVSVGQNLVPVPRSPYASVYKRVPAPLKVLSPQLSLTNDRRAGTAVGLQTYTNLVHPKDDNTASQKLQSVKPGLALYAMKSLNAGYYSLGGDLNLSGGINNGITTWNLAATAAGSSLPLAYGTEEDRLIQLRGSLVGSTPAKLVRKYTTGISLRLQHTAYNSPEAGDHQANEGGIGLYGLTDGLSAKGFVRFGLWADAGRAGNAGDAQEYTRIAARAGYAVLLGSGHNGVGIEALAGIGGAKGAIPAYRLFYAGNSNLNFMYQPLADSRNQAVPDGPLIRSLGIREGRPGYSGSAFTGATAFWHANLNISIPVARWSKPVIPYFVDSSREIPVTLADILKKAPKLAEGAIADNIIGDREFASDEEEDAANADADRQAAKITSEVQPILNYLADRANIFAVKPLLMFDVGGISQQGFASKVWTAAGVGVQLTVVIAQLDAGYMHTLSPASDASKGNFFVRLAFRNFF